MRLPDPVIQIKGVGFQFVSLSEAAGGIAARITINEALHGARSHTTRCLWLERIAAPRSGSKQRVSRVGGSPQSIQIYRCLRGAQTVSPKNHGAPYFTGAEKCSIVRSPSWGPGATTMFSIFARRNRMRKCQLLFVCNERCLILGSFREIE